MKFQRRGKGKTGKQHIESAHWNCCTSQRNHRHRRKYTTSNSSRDAKPQYLLVFDIHKTQSIPNNGQDYTDENQELSVDTGDQ